MAERDELQLTGEDGFSDSVETRRRRFIHAAVLALAVMAIVAILAALRRALRREGFAVETADSAAAALQRIDAGPVDAVLSDHKMPGMSGLELLREVAARQPGAARLLITGWPEEVPSRLRAELGLAALLPKPWEDEALKAALRAALG